jgi:hypothetical protein
LNRERTPIDANSKTPSLVSLRVNSQFENFLLRREVPTAYPLEAAKQVPALRADLVSSQI